MLYCVSGLRANANTVLCEQAPPQPVRGGVRLGRSPPAPVGPGLRDEVPRPLRLLSGGHSRSHLDPVKNLPEGTFQSILEPLEVGSH